MEQSRPDRFRPSFAAAVLAGGQSRRLGYDKICLACNGRPLLLTILGKLAALTPELILAVADTRRFGDKVGSHPIWQDWRPRCAKGDDHWVFSFPGLGPTVRCVEDLVPGSGSLGGIYTALAHSRAQCTLIVAADMPRLMPAALEYLQTQARPDKIVVPWLDGHYQPLLAVYPQTILSQCREQIVAGDLRISSLYRPEYTVLIRPDLTGLAKAFATSSENLNTPADLQRLAAVENFEPAPAALSQRRQE